MFNQVKASWALLLGIGFMMLGNGLQGTLLGVRATLEGFDTLTTGVVMAFYFVGMLAGGVFTPKLVQRVGHIRVFAALASTASIVILLHSVYVNPWTWSAMRLVTGLCYSGLYVVAESWLNDRASNENRGKILSIYMVIVTLGMGSGQFLLNLADPASAKLFILISVIISFSLVPILLTARPAPGFANSESMSLVSLYKLSPLAVISNALTGCIHGSIFGMGAVYGLQRGFDTNMVSLFMACILWGGLAFQWPIGWLSDRFGRRKLMLTSAIAGACLCLVATIVPLTSSLYFPVILVAGGVIMPMYSLCVAYANDRLPAEKIVAASGAMVISAGIGLSIGPVIVSYAMSATSPHAFFVSISIFFGLIMLAALSSMRHREITVQDVEEQAPTLALGPIGSPVAAFVAPDAADYAQALVDDELEQLDEIETQAPIAGPEVAYTEDFAVLEEDHY